MEAIELRIGNYLFSNGVVSVIDARSIFDIWDKSEKYSSIPLTEIWMERFGFIKTASYIMRLNVDLKKDIKSVIIATERHGKWVAVYTIEDAFASQGIEYVHQLQNLYFALTGEELELEKQPNKQ